MIAHYAGIAGRMFNTPLMYDPAKAATVAMAIGPRILGGAISIGGEGNVQHLPHAGVPGDPVGQSYDRAGILPFQVVSGVAVIQISGSLVHKGGYVGAASGATSYEGLQAQIARAASSSAVSAVVFDIDSFGGEVSGAFETAQMIADLSVRKPTLAILTDFALSAAYLLASQVRQIVIPEFGQAGSIGVITMHADWSQAIAASGVNITIISSGDRKTDGSPYAPLPDGVREQIQATVDLMRDRFAECVAAGRGKRMTKDQALATEAASFMGEDAVSAGLADAVSDPITAFNAFVSEINKGKTR